jgi:dihydrofolate reductase
VRLIYHLAVSLNGLATHPEGPDWLVPFAEAALVYLPRLLGEVDGLLMGRRTYEEALVLGWAYGEKPALVVSTKEGLGGPGKRVASPEEAIRLASTLGLTRLWLVGGPTLAQALLPQLSEVRLAYCPVVLEAGKPFLQGPLSLRLLGTEVLPGGVLLCRYRPQVSPTQGP